MAHGFLVTPVRDEDLTENNDVKQSTRSNPKHGFGRPSP